MRRETKFSKGPWVPFWESVNSTSCDIVVASDPNNRICTTCAGNEGEVEIANSHLIAAAPDLYEKAETLVLMHVAEQEGLRPPTPQQWMDAVDELGTALAKARGEA